MDRIDVHSPISVLLSGDNYALWMQSMKSFLIGRKLWRVVTGDILPPVKPVRVENVDPTSQALEAYVDKLEDWDSKNHQILTWFRNTCASAIQIQLAPFDTAKEAWDFLAARFQTTGLAHYYQMLSNLHTTRQEPGQSINDFLAQVQSIKHQLDQTDISPDHIWLIQILMALRPEYETARASLLHRHPLPSLDAAIKELIFEETRLRLNRSVHLDSALAVSSRIPSSSRPPYRRPTITSICKICSSHNHTYDVCPNVECHRCHGLGHIATNCRSQRSGKSTFKTRDTSRSPLSSGSLYTAAATNEPLTHQEIENIVKQVICSNSAMSVTSGTSHWYFDSACCNHMTSDFRLLSSISSISSLPPIHTANGTRMNITHTGSVSSPSLSLTDTYCIPQLALNLISVGQLVEQDLTVSFSSSGVQVQDAQGQIIGRGRKTGRLFELESLQNLRPHSFSAALTSPSSSFQWHLRLGHASSNKIQMLHNKGLLGPGSFESFDCLHCKLGKQPALSFSNNLSTADKPFHLVHSDIWGPSPVSSMNGFRYFVIFIDDFSRFTWIYFLKNRSELSTIYIQFARMIHTQFSCPIQIIRTDNALEYSESSFLQFLANEGTIVQRSCPYTSQQNGRAERKHRHILDTVRTLLLSAECPDRFWGEAALTAVHTINRLPSSVLQNVSPFEKLYGRASDYTQLHPFGCVSFVLLPSHEKNKLEPRARMCCFLGYGVEHKGFRCWDPVSKRLRISRHVTFWEHTLFSSLSKFHIPFDNSSPIFNISSPLFPPSDSQLPAPSVRLPPNADSPVSPEPVLDLEQVSSVSPEPVLDHVQVPDTVSESPPSPRRSSRVSCPPSHLLDYHCYSAILSQYEPRSFHEASVDPLWQQAMDEELHALDKTHTWDLIDLPPGKRPIGCKWVYKIKTHSDGSIERYKARLVAKGFSQEYGIDYEETFAPVARLTSVRCLLAISAVRKWSLHQMDVKNAFLHGTLSEEVYMTPPPGFSASGKVCKLRKALYGLKQAPRAWFATFSSALLQFGFSPCAYDSALFIRRTSSGIIILLLYVDDMIITGDDSSGISELQDYLRQHFEMKSLGLLRYFLGLEVSDTSDGYYLTQAKYASDLISRAGLTDSKTTSTPLDYDCRLTPVDGSLLKDPTLYRQLVGSLIYLTVTRPDIAHAVHIVSQFMTAPRTTHYSAVLRILRYIKGTLLCGLHFSANSSLVLTGYSDADYAGDPTDRRSTSGFCFFLGDSLISWRSKKQTLVSKSTAESEYRALADTTSELLWLRWLLTDLGAPQLDSTTLYCDNESAIKISHNDVFHERTKHIEIDCHFVRQHVTAKTIVLCSVASADQTADIFTKPLLPGRFGILLSKLKMVPMIPP